MKRGDYAALVLFFLQAACVFQGALYIPPVLPGLGDQYFNIPLSPPVEALSSIRTLGYPAFHALMGHFDWGLESYPTFHMLVLLPCILVLWWGLRAYGLTGLAALAAVSPLFYVVPVEVVMPETLAKCFAIAAVGFLLWAAGTRRVAAYIGLATSVFLAYQMRPAFLFLVGFLPVAWFFLYTRRWGVQNQFQWLRNALATGAACALPLVLFCLLRLAIVGHFGLVSFGGQNTIGISVEMLTPKTIDALPVQDRPLAQLMHRARTAWPSERLFHEHGIHADWDALTQQYVVNVNRIGRSVQAKLPASGDTQENVARDKTLNRMSMAVFSERPDLYRAWLAAAAIEGANVALQLMLGGGGDAAFRWGPKVSLGAIVLLLALALLSWPLERRAFGEGSRAQFARAATVVLFVAGLFFLLKMLLVILVEPPIPRYVQAAAFLLPCAFAALAWDRGVVLAAGLCRQPYWYGQCYAAYPAIPDLDRPLPWRPWGSAARARWSRRTGLAAALAVTLLVLVSWWTTRDARFFGELTRNYDQVREQLLHAGAPLAWRDGAGATPLHHAALHGDSEAIVHLIASGADAQATDTESATALHWAAMGVTGAPAVAPLLDAGLSPEAPGPLGLSPLHLAALFGRDNVLENLLAEGTDPDTKAGGVLAPLHLVNTIPAARILLDHGAAIDIPDGSNATPYMWAHTRELATFLLEQGADINAKEGWRSFIRECTPLHKAAYQEDLDTARWLLDHGANPNESDINGMSPLYYAIWRNHRPLAELLLERGANPNHPGRWVAYHRDDPGPRYTGIYGKTVGRNPRRGAFAALVPDKAAFHPLDFAAFIGNGDMIALLLSRGADLGVHNEIGMSALHWSILGGRADSARHLESHDPDLTQLDDPRLPVAAFRESVDKGGKRPRQAAAAADPRAGLHAALQREVEAYQAGAPNILEAENGFLFTRQACEYLLENDLVHAAPGDSTSGPAPAFTSIVDVHRQLAARGIHLIVVPVPVAIEVHADAFYPPWNPKDEAQPARGEFIRALQADGVDAIDLLPAFQEFRIHHPGEALYLESDGHWNSAAIGLAARLLGDHIRALDKVDVAASSTVAYTRETYQHHPGLTALAKRLPPDRQRHYEDDRWDITRIRTPEGAAYQDDEASPVLVAGDSYTLIFQEFTGHFSARLAADLGFPLASLQANAAGPMVPRVLARKGKAYIDQRRVILWVFSGSYIRPQGKDTWSLVPLPE